MKWFRESLSLFSSSVIKKWILVVIPFCAFFMFWISGGGGLDRLFGVAGYLGYLFITGVPFIVGAALLFGSQESQNNIADAYRADKKMRFASLFTSYTIMMLLVMSAAAVAGFIIILPSIPSDQILIFLSSLLVSTLTVSLLICPITVFMVLIFDEQKTATGFGILIFLAIAYATGFPRSPVNYPEVAFFGPAHILTALLFTLIGGFGNFAVNWYVGVDFVPSHLAIPLSVFLVLAVISFAAAQLTFKSRLRHWVTERELLMARKETGELWSDTEQKMSSETQARLTNDLLNFRNKLKERRKFAAAFLITAMLLIPVGGMTYVSVQQEAWTTVVYETSDVTLELGVDWLYSEFRGMENPDNIILRVGIRGEIAGGKGGYASYNFNHRRMTLDEYLLLNETEHEAMFASGTSGSGGYSETFGGGMSGPINEYTYVWALRFLEVGGQTEGSITISFRVIIQAMPN